VETLAWPSHSWTFAISASCEGVLVAAVARRECTKLVNSAADARLDVVYADDGFGSNLKDRCGVCHTCDNLQRVKYGHSRFAL